jgi:hypothetical protein
VIELLLQAERALEMGRIDAAETLYRQVAEADPRNSIAVVGLARVSLERGDELGAYLTARRALAIDGENAAASRMVQRLEEVMRFRGDPVPVVPDAADVGAAAETPAPPAEPGPTRPASPRLDETLTPVGPARRRRSSLARIIARILGRS